MNKEYSTETIITNLQKELFLNHDYDNLEDYFEDTYNGDPVVNGRYKANEQLKAFNIDDVVNDEYGDNVFSDGVEGAIQYITAYEMDLAGEVWTDLTEPEQILTMVAYINADYLINELSSETGIDREDFNIDNLNDLGAILDFEEWLNSYGLSTIK